MKKSQSKQIEIFEKLGIESIQDLRQYILSQYLELMQSEKPEIKLQAIREISKYLFNFSGNMAFMPIGNELKDKTDILEMLNQ